MHTTLGDKSVTAGDEKNAKVATINTVFSLS
jgi:hypothetical protein